MAPLPLHTERAVPRHRAPHRHPVVLALVLLAVLVLGGAVWSMTGSPEDAGDQEPAVTATPEPSSTQAAVDPPRLDARLGAERTVPMEAVALRGQVEGVPPGAQLQVQLRDREGRWVSFPLRPVVDQSGRFESYVELGARGVHQLRVLEPSTGLTSTTLVLTVR